MTCVTIFLNDAELRIPANLKKIRKFEPDTGPDLTPEHGVDRYGERLMLVHLMT